MDREIVADSIGLTDQVVERLPNMEEVLDMHEIHGNLIYLN